MNITFDIIKSISATEGNANKTSDLLAWINDLNSSTLVKINDISLDKDAFWFYDESDGFVKNKKNAFFTIKGLKTYCDDKVIEQPIIDQPEIGYLGIICKKIDGVLNFLMQGKIEPGNVNCVQISPTVQATRSNFTKVHGGKQPAYIEYFLNAKNECVVFDQIQSEQSSRFYKKRNRNIIILIEDEIDLLPNFKWMTLGQLKNLMKYDNLVNMDTRTVISGIPLSLHGMSDEQIKQIQTLFNDMGLYKSTFETNPHDSLTSVYRYINNIKMFNNVDSKIVPLYELDNWVVSSDGITCRNKSDFSVGYYDIFIEGREVVHWSQPMFKATGSALFGLIEKEFDGVTKFLIKVRREAGCFDVAELGPSVQLESSELNGQLDVVEAILNKYIESNNTVADVVLSEEGGRFYHEQNRNVIIKIREYELTELPEGYFWVDYSTLNYLVQINNCLNIQLRNLLSLIMI